MKHSQHVGIQLLGSGPGLLKRSKYDFRSEQTGFEGGFGRQVLGDTWSGHHGMVNGKYYDRAAGRAIFTTRYISNVEGLLFPEVETIHEAKPDEERDEEVDYVLSFGLCERNDEVARPELSISHAQSGVESFDVNSAAHGCFDEAPDGTFILGVVWYDESVWWFIEAPIDGFEVHSIEITFQLRFPAGDELEHAEGERFFVVDYITEAPPATIPRIGIIALRDIAGESGSESAETSFREIERGGDSCACHLGENSDHVVPERSLRHRSLEIGVEPRACDDAAESFRGHVREYVVADLIDDCREERMGVRVDGIGIGRNEKSRAGRAHLMLVENDFREPLMVKNIGYEPAFGKVEEEPVSVVVMTCIVMIELRKR